MVVFSEFVMHDFAGFLLRKIPFMNAGTDMYRLCAVHITIPDERKNYSELSMQEFFSYRSGFLSQV